MPPMQRPPTPTESRLTPAATTTTRAIVQVSAKSKRLATEGGRGACFGDLQRRAGVGSGLMGFPVFVCYLLNAFAVVELNAIDCAVLFVWERKVRRR